MPVIDGERLHNETLMDETKSLKRALSPSLDPVTPSKKQSASHEKSSNHLKDKIQEILNNDAYSHSSKSSLISDLVEQQKEKSILDEERRKLLPPNRNLLQGGGIAKSSSSAHTKTKKTKNNNINQKIQNDPRAESLNRTTWENSTDESDFELDGDFDGAHDCNDDRDHDDHDDEDDDVDEDDERDTEEEDTENAENGECWNKYGGDDTEVDGEDGEVAEDGDLEKNDSSDEETSLEPEDIPLQFAFGVKSIVSKFKNRLNAPPKKTTIDLLRRNSRLISTTFEKSLSNSKGKGNSFILIHNNIFLLDGRGQKRFVFSIEKLLTSITFPRRSIFNFLSCMYGSIKAYTLLEKNAIRKIVRASRIPLKSIPCVKMRNLCV